LLTARIAARAECQDPRCGNGATPAYSTRKANGRARPLQVAIDEATGAWRSHATAGYSANALQPHDLIPAANGRRPACHPRLNLHAQRGGRHGRACRARERAPGRYASRRPGSHPPAARRDGTCPMPGQAPSTPSPHRITNSINASLGNAERRPPAKRAAGQARIPAVAGHATRAR